ncbi:ARMT1-like domain-containing protein [Dactylosporangium sp. NPDC051485]|uniref:ARMT1-like domain-containing protein n=1 Tax=Dactylosporangium sp. NPDC051485 TaxID=3154846 RepID=UPI00341E6BD9
MRNDATSRTRELLPPEGWRHVDALAWGQWWPYLLGTDRPDPDQVRRILVTDTYQPDSFTVAERMTGPAWLEAGERDGEAWLADLVQRRLTAALTGSFAIAAAAHVLGEVRRVLEHPHGDGIVAESLWNQEVPYLVDRVAAWCLFSDPTMPNSAPADRFNFDGRVFLAQFLVRLADRLDRLDTAQLARVAVAAGLVGLDRKGGSLRCRPLPLPAVGPHGRTVGPLPLAEVWAGLRGYADTNPAVDHLDGLLDTVSAGPARLVWWLDDLIETGFDLLLVQRLIAVNPHLHVTVVPKRGRYDNDACTADVVRLLRLTPFARLRAATGGGRLVVSDRGPRMATANPTKLHPTLIGAIERCDVMVCKGGRVHEMFSGNVAAPIYTAYVVVRPFTESQSGLDSSTAPLAVFGADAGEWPWWGFHGRATRTTTLPSGRPIAACHTTVADHHRHATSGDPLSLAADLHRLVSIWSQVKARYRRAATAELRLVHDRLVPHAAALPSTLRHLLPAAAEIITLGDSTYAPRPTDHAAPAR